MTPNKSETQKEIYDRESPLHSVAGFFHFKPQNPLSLMLDAAEISKLIVHLLSARSPEFGARLKQRLNALLRERNLEPFDERRYGYKKFQDFLEKGQTDIVQVIRHEDGGDIQVSLKEAAQAAVEAPVIQSVVSPSEWAGRPIRSDVWQAFANPDPERRRYLDRQTLQIFHYTPTHNLEVQTKVSLNPAQYAEIPPIQGDTQMGWMREFLDAVPVTGPERNVLDQMLAQPYSSALNAAFTRSLASKAALWREHRLKLVLNTIFNWAKANNIDIDRLRTPEEKPVAERPAALSFDSLGAVTPRLQAAKLLELLSDEDIGRVVLPVLLSTILIKARL